MTEFYGEMLTEYHGNYAGPCDCGETLYRVEHDDGSITFQHGDNREHVAMFGPDLWDDAPVDEPHPRVVAWTDAVHAAADAAEALVKEGEDD